MASIRILGRLLRLRELEEDQSRVLLKAKAGERDNVNREMALAIEETEEGRTAFHMGVGRRDAIGRAAGLVAGDLGNLLQKHLAPRLRAVEVELELQRAEFLNRRTSRLQVETLEAEARRLESVEVERRAQQMLDDWYGRRSHLRESKPAPEPMEFATRAEKEEAAVISKQVQDGGADADH